MSTCENFLTHPRGRVCINCPLGKAGNVSKILNKLDEEGLINWQAGKYWLKRGGGISTFEEYDMDRKKAINYYTKKICRTLG